MEDNLSTENTIEVPVKEKKTFSTLPKDEWILLIILVASNALCPMSFSSIATFYLAVGTKKGLTISEVGVIFGIFNLLSFFLSPFIGKLLPIYGAKRIFAGGLMLTAISTIAFAFTDYIENSFWFFWICFVLRLIQSAGNTAFFCTSFCIAAKVYPDIMSSVLGLAECAAGAGFMLGPLFGGVLYEFGYIVPFLTLGAILSVNSVFSYFYIHDSVSEEEEHDENVQQFGFKQFAVIKDCWFIISIPFSVGLIFSFHDPTIPVALEQFNLSPSQLGLFFLLIGGIYAVSVPILGMFLDKFKMTNYLLISGNSLLIISLLILGPAPFLGFERNMYVFAIGLAIQGVAGAQLFIPCFKQSLIIVQEHGYPDNMTTTGIISGIFTASFSLGAFIGPTGGAILLDYFNYVYTTTIFSALQTIYFATFIAFYLVPRYIKSKQQGQVYLAENANLDAVKIVPLNSIKV